MTVIAWDSKILAADRQVTFGDTKSAITKLFKVPASSPGVHDRVLAITGNAAFAMMMKRWYLEGADPAKFPEHPDGSEFWAQLIVATPEGVSYYEQMSEPLWIEDPFAAWGVGREVALGAMEMGATAIQAVEAACKWIDGCGRGCDWYKVRD